MRFPKISEEAADVTKSALVGASKGGAVAAAASLATGAAVIITAPAWLPIIGGTMAVSAATVAAWTCGGSAIGAATAGTRRYLKNKRLNQEYEKVFSNQKEQK